MMTEQTYTQFEMQKRDFEEALTKLINQHKIDSRCTTPDYILARHLVETMESYRTTKRALADWFIGEQKDETI